jgi:hypothetical protein
MKFTTLIAFLLLPWAVVEGRPSRAKFVSIGMENSLSVLLLDSQQNESHILLLYCSKQQANEDIAQDRNVGAGARSRSSVTAKFADRQADLQGGVSQFLFYCDRPDYIFLFSRIASLSF